MIVVGVGIKLGHGSVMLYNRRGVVGGGILPTLTELLHIVTITITITITSGGSDLVSRERS